MSVKQTLGVLTVLGGAFASTAHAADDCKIDFIDVNQVANHLLVMQPADWPLATIASFGTDVIEQLVDEIKTDRVKGLNLASKKTYDALAKNLKNGTKPDWDALYENATLPDAAILDGIQDSGLDEDILDAAREAAADAVSEFIDEALTTLDGITVNPAKTICLENGPTAPAV